MNDSQFLCDLGLISNSIIYMFEADERERLLNELCSLTRHRLGQQCEQPHLLLRTFTCLLAVPRSTPSCITYCQLQFASMLQRYVISLTSFQFFFKKASKRERHRITFSQTSYPIQSHSKFISFSLFSLVHSQKHIASHTKDFTQAQALATSP